MGDQNNKQGIRKSGKEAGDSFQDVLAAAVIGSAATLFCGWMAALSTAQGILSSLQSLLDWQ
jgi:predicted phage tail protein